MTSGRLQPLLQAFAGRLDEACDIAGIPEGRSRASALAKRFGVSREAVRLWMSSAGIPDVLRVVDIATELNVCIDWLVAGRGCAVRDAACEGLADDGIPHTEDERRLSAAIQGLNASNRAALAAFLETLEPRTRQPLEIPPACTRAPCGLACSSTCPSPRRT
jgi:hypothetical protein